MNSTQRTIGGIAASIIILGGIWIVYAGRPVMKLNSQLPTPSSGTSVSTTPSSTSTPTTPTAISDTGTPTPTTNSGHTFTMADIALHASEGDCWSAINGNVYDLTSWVSRHPGGARPIVSMCGKDGSAAFERKHGGESRPQSALILLKIGTLR